MEKQLSMGLHDSEVLWVFQLGISLHANES